MDSLVRSTPVDASLLGIRETCCPQPILSPKHFVVFKEIYSNVPFFRDRLDSLVSIRGYGEYSASMVILRTLGINTFVCLVFNSIKRPRSIFVYRM
jgi:hypothetical protein